MRHASVLAAGLWLLMAACTTASPDDLEAAADASALQSEADERLAREEERAAEIEAQQELERALAERAALERERARSARTAAAQQQASTQPARRQPCIPGEDYQTFNTASRSGTLEAFQGYLEFAQTCSGARYIALARNEVDRIERTGVERPTITGASRTTTAARTRPATTARRRVTPTPRPDDDVGGEETSTNVTRSSGVGSFRSDELPSDSEDNGNVHTGESTYTPPSPAIVEAPLTGAGNGGGGPGSGIGVLGAINTGSTQEPADPTAGRIAHHAPSTMVAGHPYILEVLIRPIEATTDIAAVDSRLRAEIGAAPNPSGDAARVAITNTTIGRIMIARLQAAGAISVVPITPERQPVLPNQTAKWAWAVTANEGASAASLIFSVLREIESGGETFEQSVKTLPLSVSITSVDDLLIQASASADLTRSRGGQPREATSFAAESFVPNARSRSINTDQPVGSCDRTQGTDPDRHALILSNASYVESVGPLSLTHTDGERVSDAVSSLGYSVTHCRDLNDIETEAALRTHGQTLRDRKNAGGEPSAFFYYSGHGVTQDGRSFLIPTNLDNLSEDIISRRGIDSERIINLVGATGASTAFIVFDACRNTVGKGASKGIAPVGWGSAGGGLLQAYATAPGATAADNGYYSEALATALRSSDKKADLVFDDVQTIVANRSNNTQIPFTSDGFTRDFYFQ
ncbi:MAG: caspase family protein [Pseudomonadota bacterium]